jgi:hypothetical protein
VSRSGGPPDPRDRATPAPCRPPDEFGASPPPVGSTPAHSSIPPALPALSAAAPDSSRPGRVVAQYVCAASGAQIRCSTWSRRRPAVHSPVGRGTVVVAASGVVRRSLAPVTSVDWSTSCPQRCAQVGEISPRPLTRRDDRLGVSTASSTPGDPCRSPADLPVRRTAGGRGPVVGTQRPRTWVRTGDGRWGTGGQDVERRRPMCVTVEMSTCRHRSPPVHPQSANMSTSALTCADGLDPQVPHQ